MMENLIICESERFGNIRVLVENGTPLLCGSDVTAILGYQNSRKALARINATRQKRPLPTDGGIQYMTVLNTPDFLRLISRCHTPEARAFESWAKKELLPALEFFAYMAEDESEDCSTEKKSATACNRPLAKEKKEHFAMDDETMFMIHGEDYLRHINDKVGMYLLVKELTKSVSDLPDCPANHGTRHFSKIVDAVAENAFKNWDIPESYATSSDTGMLYDLMDAELFTPDEAGYELADDMREDTEPDESDEEDRFDDCLSRLLKMIDAELKKVPSGDDMEY